MLGNYYYEVTFKDGDFERDYSYSVDAEGTKVPSGYTKAELLAGAPAVLDEVFAHHKAVTVFVEGAAGPGGLVVPGGEGLHGGEPPDGQRGDVVGRRCRDRARRRRSGHSRQR